MSTLSFKFSKGSRHSEISAWHCPLISPSFIFLGSNLPIRSFTLADLPIFKDQSVVSLPNRLGTRSILEWRHLPMNTCVSPPGGLEVYVCLYKNSTFCSEYHNLQASASIPNRSLTVQNGQSWIQLHSLNEFLCIKQRKASGLVNEFLFLLQSPASVLGRDLALHYFIQIGHIYWWLSVEEIERGEKPRTNTRPLTGIVTHGLGFRDLWFRAKKIRRFVLSQCTRTREKLLAIRHVFPQWHCTVWLDLEQHVLLTACFPGSSVWEQHRPWSMEDFNADKPSPARLQHKSRNQESQTSLSFVDSQLWNLLTVDVKIREASSLNGCQIPT